jgi:dimethylglycine dehydrogenase
MRSQARAVVIGGGVVGCPVLYHLAELGWTDSVLIERDELTSGSAWHAAGSMHTINGDPNVAKLQKYTIDLYKEIEALSEQPTGRRIQGISDRSIAAAVATLPLREAAPTQSP